MESSRQDLASIRHESKQLREQVSILKAEKQGLSKTETRLIETISGLRCLHIFHIIQNHTILIND